MYKVLLVDDEALIREAISENIQWEEMGFSFMGACENGRQMEDLQIFRRREFVDSLFGTDNK